MSDDVPAGRVLLAGRRDQERPWEWSEAEKEQRMSAIDDIAQERLRQMHQEGWSLQHDDRHTHGELAQAAGCYALHAGLAEPAQVPAGFAPQDWPWDAKWWKPKDRRRDLVRAAALIVAEIERLDRAGLRK